MTKNGQKWSKMNIFEKKNRRDRILSRRDLIDGLKICNNIAQRGINIFFFIFRPKKFENGQKQSKNDQKNENFEKKF